MSKLLLQCVSISSLAALLTACGTADQGTESASESASDLAPGWTFCANQGSRCEFSGTRTVRYGTSDKYVEKTFTDGVNCDNATFGNPARWKRKTCAYKNDDAEAPPAPAPEEEETTPAPASGDVKPASPVSGTYHLAFRDEFNGISIQNPHEDANRSPGDISRGWWRPILKWGGTTSDKDSRYTGNSAHHGHGGNGERQWYVWNQYELSNGQKIPTKTFTQKDGVLTIHGRPLNQEERKVESDKLVKWGLEYFSGIMTTYPNYTQRYGYFELRARMPKDGPGLWPAFWLLPADWSWPPEVDIFEFIGKGGKEKNGGFQGVFQTVHFNDANGKHDGDGELVAMPGGAHADDGFHIYGFEWLPNKLVFYIDGKKVYTQTRTIDKPMYMLINLAIGGGWPGDPNASTPWPAEMKLDYVRAFSTSKPAKVLGPG